MPVKYKGDLDMYFVTGIRPELREPDGSPNRKFLARIEMIRILDVEEHVFSGTLKSLLRTSSFTALIIYGAYHCRLTCLRG